MTEAKGQAKPWSMLERRILAAALLFLSAMLFASLQWFWDFAIPTPIWLVLVGLAALAVAAAPPEIQPSNTEVASTTEEPALATAPADALPSTPTLLPASIANVDWNGEERRRSHLIFSAASHELRTPINAIVGFAELLRDAERHNTGRKAREDYATTILENAKQLQQRLNEVLDANRIESASLYLTEQDCDPAELVEVVTRQRQDAAAERNITIIARLADGLNLNCDSNRLRQAFACVLDNAIKFSSAEGIININMLKDRGGQLIISTTNTGPVLNADDKAQIFDPFRQVDEGSSRYHGGLGLGLFIARGILRLHGGDVTLTSTAETGTDVRIVMPASRVKWLNQKKSSVAEARVA